MSKDPIFGRKLKFTKVLDCEVFEGNHEGLISKMMEERLFEKYGLFKSIIPEPCPKIISAFREGEKILSYCMLFRDSDFYKWRSGYVIGFWTRPKFRNQGLARIVSDSMALYLHDKLEPLGLKTNNIEIVFSPPSENAGVYEKLFHNMPCTVRLW